MLSKRLRLRNRRRVRNQIARSDALISEVLERRQMLTANGDQVLYEVELYDSDRQPTGWKTVSHSYSAPWTGVGGQTGGHASSVASQWTSPNKLTEEAGQFALHENQITTIEGFKHALHHKQVKEVSSELMGVFYDDATNSLYDPKIVRAWTSSSDNLYSLLVLNQRYPAEHGLGESADPNGTSSRRGGNGNPNGISVISEVPAALEGTPGRLSITLSNKALQGLARIVGFGFTGPSQDTLLTSTGALPKLAIFSTNSSQNFRLAQQPHKTIHNLDIDIPTVNSLFNLTNELAPVGSKLPNLVRDYVNDIYRANYGTKNPIETFSELSGINDLSSLLADPNLSVANKSVVYDASAYNPQNITNPQFSAYKTVCEEIGGYYLSTTGKNNKQAVHHFFKEFADAKINDLKSATVGTSLYSETLTQLASGFRALMAMSYDASPFWSSYGIGFSNGANPLILKTLAAQKTSPIETYAGQEFQVRNVEVPKHFLNVETYDPSHSSNPTFPAETWPTDGWDTLESPTILSGANFITKTPGVTDSTDVVANTSYRWHGEITSPNTSVIFQKQSHSSDTIDARFISAEGSLNPESPTGIGNKTFVELDGEINNFLPASFTTYISTSGGVDLVHGSQYADVIVGPSRAATHGRLTVSAGNGADLVAPGRGGSLVELGSGSDTVFFSSNDIFGETTFVDFTRNSQDQDVVVLGRGLSVQIAPETPWEATITDSSTGATKLLRLAGNSIDHWEYIFFESVANASEDGISPTPNGEFNYLETHAIMDPGATPLKRYELHIKTKIRKDRINPSDPMSINQLRAGDYLSVSIGKHQNKYVVYNMDGGTEYVGAVIPLNEFPDAIEDGRALAISVTPLRLPVDPSFQVFTGKVTQGYSNAELSAEAKQYTFHVSGVDVGSSYPFIRDYMQQTDGSPRYGSSMYLFDNTGGIGTGHPNNLGARVGKVIETAIQPDGTGTVTVFVDPSKMGPGAQLNTGTNLGWQFADAPSYGGQQFEIFINRHNGYLGFYPNVTTEEFTIKASTINAAIPGGPLSNSYNLATNSATKNSHLPFSKWVALPYTSGPTRQFAYMGGLAKFIYEKNLHYSSDRTSFPAISIVLDEDDLLVGSGSGKVNLSSNFSVFEVDSSLGGLTPEQFVDNLNAVQADVSGGQYAIPTGMPDASESSFKGTYSLATKSQIFVTGSGRINAWNVYSDPTYVAGALNRSPKSNHPDWQSNIYYTIGSDILTASSAYIPPANAPSNYESYAIIANSFTSAWPLIKGIGGVRFQDFDSLGLIGQNGLSVVDKNDLTPENPLRFKSSPVFLREFKQLGGWIWQADGPQIAGWNSTITQSFIHANDDSLKFGAPGLNADQITILQGKAGVAVGTSYGYLNGGFNRGVAGGIYAHRVVTDNEIDTALVSIWNSPVTDYFWWADADSQTQGIRIEEVFVPELPLWIAQINTKDPKAGGGNLNYDLNYVNRAANVDFAQNLRTFSMKTSINQPLDLELGNIELYKNWEINTAGLRIPNSIEMNYNSIPGGSIVKTPQGYYRNYTGVSGQWTQIPATTAIAPPYYYSDQIETSYDVGVGPDVTITQSGTIQLYSNGVTQISRPQLKRASKIRLDRDSNVIGPQPVRLMYSAIERAVSSDPSAADNLSYVITELASGKVEKKQGDSWVDVSTPPRSSNPFELLALLQRRIIKPSDEIRWVPDTEDQGEVSTKAFELIGWNGTTASEKETTIEIDAGGWSDL